jgi:site-specific DNA-methyltransferase (adenine-specific)
MLPKPYYQDDDYGITIYCGDCREILPELSPVELICSDPPYGLNYNDGDLASQREKAFGGNMANCGTRPIANDGEEQAMALFEWLCRVANEKLLKGGCCCCCCCCGGGPKPLFAKWTLIMDKHIGFKQAVVWDKGGLGMGIHYRRNYEFMLVAQKGSPAHTWNGGNTTPNVWRINKIIPSKHQHPTEKPVELMGKTIQIHSNEGDTVLDPFMGTGATVVAAKNLGRRAIGIEIEEKYCEIAVKRLAQDVFRFE